MLRFPDLTISATILAVALLLLVAYGCEDDTSVAMYLLQPDHLQGAASAAEIEAARNAGLVVSSPACNPDSARAWLAEIGNPHNVTLLAAFNSHQYPIWGPNHVVWEAYRSALGEDIILVSKDTGERVSTWPPEGEPTTWELRAGPVAGHRVAVALAAVYFDGYDGVYLDELWADLPPWMERATAQHDADWISHTAALLQTLRKHLPDIAVVGNVGARADIAADMFEWTVDGITVESVHVTNPDGTIDPDKKRRAVAGMEAFDAALCVAWGWSPPAGVARYGISLIKLEG